MWTDVAEQTDRFVVMFDGYCAAGMCTADMCTDIHADMCTDMCVGMSTDIV